MAALVVKGGTPVLLVGEQDKVQGEIWLFNPTAGDVTVTGALLSVTLPTSVETGPIQLPEDAVVPANSMKRLVIAMGMQPFTPPGSYAAHIDLDTSAGAQTIPATLVLISVLAVGLAAERLVFTGVAAATTVTGSVVVRNRGNVPVVVGHIPDEPLFEVVATPRILALNSTGDVSVGPSFGLASLGGKLTFTNATPTIEVGGWADVTFDLTTPGGLGANLHVRATPRIATERFAIHLLTV